MADKIHHSTAPGTSERPQARLAPDLTNEPATDLRNERNGEVRLQVYQRKLVATFLSAKKRLRPSEEYVRDFASFLAGLESPRGGKPSWEWMLLRNVPKMTKQWNAVVTIDCAIVEELKREESWIRPRSNRIRALKRVRKALWELPMLLHLSPPSRERPNSEWVFLADVIARYTRGVLQQAGHPARSLEPKSTTVRVVCSVLCLITGRRFTCEQVSGVLKRVRKGLEAELEAEAAEFEQDFDRR